MPPVIYVSNELKAALSAVELADLIGEFRWWKTDAAAREYESPVFGKDSKLLRPTVDGAAYVISHCHLIPKNSTSDYLRWQRDFRRRARKTSDRVLFYIEDAGKFFLVDIVDDPGAHEIMRMTDATGRAFMNKCAQQAKVFLDGLLTLEPA